MKKGQHLYHIMQTSDIAFSKSSAYRHLHNGYLSITKTDFPRVVKFKVRKQYRVPGVPKAVKIGRTYSDFLAYTEEHDIRHWVEMDTLIGRVGGKAIMTLHFTQMNFMFGLLLDNKSASEATEKIRALKGKFTTAGIRFGDIIPILLTDNGSEFSNVAAFTDDGEGCTETHLFFCDPYRSSQKPRVEKNHTLFRDIVPKGTSFDGFTQEDVNSIFSHLNSTRRKVLNGRCPYELFAYIYSEDAPGVPGIRPIADADVVQSPKLLRLLPGRGANQ